MKFAELFLTAMTAVFSEQSLTEFVLFGTVLLLTTTSAYVSYRSGVFNLALDGTVVTSTMAAYIFAQVVTRAVGKTGFLSILVGLAAGVGMGLLFTVLVSWVIDKTGGNDVLVGILANFGARNLSIVMMGLCSGLLIGLERTLLPALHIGALADVPVLGSVVGDANIMSWIALLLPLGAFWMMNRTSLGLCLRAAQENPEALTDAGVDLSRTRLKGMLLSGTIASMAGVACAMGAVPERATATLPQGFGYLALVIVFAAGGRLGKSIGFALIFSVLGALPVVFRQLPLPETLVSSLVYLAALVLMMLHVYRRHHRMRVKVKAQSKKRAQRKQAK